MADVSKNSCVIVALPREDDRVNRISSEKKAHMTLLFLGEVTDQDEQADICMSVEHIVKMVGQPFGMSVLNRGPLGPDEADVVFYDNSKRAIAWPEMLRTFLLGDVIISNHYLSVPQYPQWTPHTTLGYPATPAHTDDQDRPLDHVFFDRIAVWFGDSEGPEYKLQYGRDSEAVDQDDSPDAVAAWSDEAATSEGFNLDEEYGWFLDGITQYLDDHPDDDTLEQHGVRGMKWGIRKDRPAPIELKGLGPDTITRKTKGGEEITLSKNPPGRISKFLGKHSKTWAEEYNKNAFLTIKDKDGNKVGDASVEKRSKDELYLNWLGIDNKYRGRGYATAAMKTAEAYGAEAGFKKMTLEVPGNSPDARHIYEKLGFKVTKEASASELKNDTVWGGLTEMEYTFDNVKHNAEDFLSMSDELIEKVDACLKHYGVQGMRWGHRKDRRTESVNVYRTDEDGKRSLAGTVKYDPKKVKRVGRTGTTFEGKPKHVARLQKEIDAIPSAEAPKNNALKRRAAASTDSLTNKELKALVERMNLEQQYVRLSGGDASRNYLATGQKYADDVLRAKGTYDKFARDPQVQAGVKKFKAEWAAAMAAEAAAGAVPGSELVLRR